MHRYQLSCIVAMFAASVLAAPATVASDGASQEQPVAFVDSAQFLVDKEDAALVAIVQVKRADTQWVILPDGDHVSLIAAECEMQRSLFGGQAWPAKTVQTVTQFDYSDLLVEPISPPVIDGRRYLLIASPSSKTSEVPQLSPWSSYPQGFLLVRSRNGEEFVYWNGKSYSLSDIARKLATKEKLPLDQIVDPARRLRVAKSRLKAGDLGNAKAFIHGLVMNVADPEGQARQVERAPKSAGPLGSLGLAQVNGQPHALWYESLALLRDTGIDADRRKDVIETLAPIARTSPPPKRLAAALALVDLGSEIGREALIEGFEKGSGAVSSDPSDRMTFPGRYPYDESSVTASAHALARLGDLRGLKHPKADVRLATAEAVGSNPNAEVERMLQGLIAELQPKVDELRSNGALAKPRARGDLRNRLPEDWVRAERLLARRGNDQSFRQLVEAYLEDAATYPQKQPTLVPRGQLTTWSGGLSPAKAVIAADVTPSRVLGRLQKIYGMDSRWDAPAFQAIRTALAEPTSARAKEVSRPKPTEDDVAKLLGDENVKKRAEGLAAAGYHQMDTFYDRVLAKAIRGQGVERQAAIYSLGFYKRVIPETTLRQILATDDAPQLRLSAVELATRRNGTPFAGEVMNLVQLLASKAAEEKPNDWEARRSLAYMPRILSRLARGPIPKPVLDGLKNPDPVVRAVVVQGLALSGNPDAVPNIRALLGDRSSNVREASQMALLALGPTNKP